MQRETRNKCRDSDKTGRLTRETQYGCMDEEELEHESRRRKLPTEPRMRQVTYWRQKPEVSPDKRSQIRGGNAGKTSMLVWLFKSKLLIGGQRILTKGRIECCAVIEDWMAPLAAYIETEAPIAFQ